VVAVINDTKIDAEIEVDVLIIGGGAAGLTAALAANEAGKTVLIAERESRLSGSTALSSGLIPAAGTRVQASQSITDDVDVFYGDIMGKNKNKADPVHVRRVVSQIPKTIDWLTEQHKIPFIVLDNFLYPGHSNHRMHAVPEVTGSALIDRLEVAVQAQDITIVTDLQITDLIVTASGQALGARCCRPDGSVEAIAAPSIVLACNGYGGNPDLVAKHIPEMRGAIYFGHPGNQGEAVLWGQQLGASIADLSGYQGHGSVAHPHGILITWALMMEGGIQVNKGGKRFSNEHQGYSEQAVSVLAQPDRIAFNIIDNRLRELGRDFEDFRQAEAANAFVEADTIVKLAEKLRIDPTALTETLAVCEKVAQSGEEDTFGRCFDKGKLLAAPFSAVRVTGTLFHTQGGLVINDNAQICREDGGVFGSLFACGGAACGVSGPNVSGYLSGNGLLTALSLGHIAGQAAAGISS
jgi:fumarate reductase flavoprotein subunit